MCHVSPSSQKDAEDLDQGMTLLVSFDRKANFCNFGSISLPTPFKSIIITMVNAFIYPICRIASIGSLIIAKESITTL